MHAGELIIVFAIAILSLWLLVASQAPMPQIVVWLVAYGILLYAWYASSSEPVLTGLSVLFLVNILLNFSVLYVTHALHDARTAFILNILLVSSSIGIFLQLRSPVRWVFLLYLAWTVVLLFSSVKALRQ